MAYPERFEALILGSGAGGKLLAWHLARSGRRTAVVERRWIGGSCSNVKSETSRGRSGAPDDGGGTWPALVECAATDLSIRVPLAAGGASA
jgi:glycine/D-amino acid oxidase-like deaminating enzyme